MKKTILILLSTVISTVCLAQVKKDTARKYVPDPNRVYNLNLHARDIQTLLQTSQAGFIPFLKSIKLPMDKLDEAQTYFNNLQQTVIRQFREQFAADSLKAVRTSNHLEKQ